MLSQTEFNRLVQLYPREEGESRTVWIERIYQAAAKREEAAEPARPSLPYRDPGEDDE